MPVPLSQQPKFTLPQAISAIRRHVMILSVPEKSESEWQTFMEELYKSGKSISIRCFSMTPVGRRLKTAEAVLKPIMQAASVKYPNCAVSYYGNVIVPSLDVPSNLFPLCGASISTVDTVMNGLIHNGLPKTPHTYMIVNGGQKVPLALVLIMLSRLRMTNPSTVLHKAAGWLGLEGDEITPQLPFTHLVLQMVRDYGVHNVWNRRLAQEDD